MTLIPPAKSKRSACYGCWLAALFLLLALGLALLIVGMLSGPPPYPALPV